MACAKHFPGHGRTTEDSHATLPHVKASRAALYDEMEPFRATIHEGVDAIMTAHVVFDALDGDNPATLSQTIINDILRRDLRFDGLVVTDGMGMQGILDACDGSEAAAGIAAVNAGCDVLLYPTDIGILLDAVNAEHGRRLSRIRVEQAVERIRSAALTAHARPLSRPDGDNEQWSLDVAYKSVQAPGDKPDVPRAFDLLTIDDDLGGPHPAPARDVFVGSLRAAGFEPQEVSALSVERPAVIAVYADIRAWKGAPGLSPRARETLDNALRARSDATVVLFAHPRLAEGLGFRHVVSAWGGEAIMQKAAAAWLANASGRR
jgi:beta-glucosidase-like glycosyl hydrolase